MHSIEELTLYLREFARARDWEQFHNPKNLCMALSIEVAEACEHFQWLTPEQAQNLNSNQKEAVALELADIQMYLVRLADQLGIDIWQAINTKTQLNEAKYPAALVRGNAAKYTAYQQDLTSNKTS
ncbi:MAG TPA: nucleotide pyrophosphohydrolase [Cellvibrionaceae bacterium]|nr:nucleotide pyrophosphohydrolase [Cellvibrionaceae bacterium]HMW73985.1 nucleotide pyrophosphohydrolase [Cellvibrionaceae bacterium]